MTCLRIPSPDAGLTDPHVRIATSYINTHRRYVEGHVPATILALSVIPEKRDGESGCSLAFGKDGNRDARERTYLDCADLMLTFSDEYSGHEHIEGLSKKFDFSGER